MNIRRTIFTGFLLLAAATLVSAQDQPQDPWEQTRFRTGPLAWTPTVQLKNLGWDTNVFNAVEDPKTDFTLTLSPQIDWWLRAGRARLHGTNVVDGVYFATYTAERSINQRHQLTIEYPLNRIRPYAGASYLDTRDRPGFEIDARAAHTEWTARAGAAIRVSGKTSLDLGGRYTDYAFEGDAQFEGTNLSEVLNRQAAYGAASVRYKLTPLTTLTVLGEAGQEQFKEAPNRDNTSLRLMPGVEFDPFALLKGSASVGFRRLDMKSPAVKDYAGVVARVDLAYVLMARTRFSMGLDRDVAFSFEELQPYYVLTGFSGSVRQSLARGWDLEARAARQRLAYQSATGVPDRVDNVDVFGGGVGYRLSGGSRAGVFVEQVRRRSPRYNRDYEGLRGGLTMSYGF